MSTISESAAQVPEWKQLLPAISLVLVFLVVFTGQRRSAVEHYEDGGKPVKPATRRDQQIFGWTLMIPTALLLLTSAPAVFSAVEDFAPLRARGAAPSALLLAWLLLAALLYEQWRLVRRVNEMPVRPVKPTGKSG